MSTTDKFREGILESKKQFFINTVLEASKRFGVQQPIVRFWDCPNFESRTIAHCHTDSFTICISESTLSNLDNSQIYETATHEVTHLIHKEHDAHFHSAHDNLKISSFKPEAGGIVQISEESLSKTSKRKFYYTPSKRKCNYVQSKEHFPNGIKECPFCKRFFCKNHLTPRPILSNFEKDRVPRVFDKETNNPESHPCPPYTLIFMNNVKKLKESENKKVANFFEKRRKRKNVIYETKVPKRDKVIFGKLKLKKQFVNSKAKITHFKRRSNPIKKVTLWERIKKFTRR